MSTSIKRALVIGGLAVAALGAGGVAWAATSDSSAGSPTAAATGPAATGRAHQALGRAELRADHATWVTGKNAKFVTHQEIRGTITAVDATSITLKAADGYSETFKVDAQTKVHVRGETKGAGADVAQLKVGEKAGVLGTGTAGPTADRIVAGTGAKKASGTSSHTSTGSTTTSG